MRWSCPGAPTGAESRRAVADPPLSCEKDRGLSKASGKSGTARKDQGRFRPNARLDRRVTFFAMCCQTVDHFDNPITDNAEFHFAEAPRCARWRAKAYAACDRRLSRLERDSVLVAGDVRPAQSFFRRISFTPLGRGSTSIRWVSVPPVTVPRPPFIN